MTIEQVVSGVQNLEADGGGGVRLDGISVRPAGDRSASSHLRKLIHDPKVLLL